MRRGWVAGLLFLLLLLSVAAFAAGEFGSVGLAVVPTATGELVVLKVVEGSPAAKAGLQPGDLIVEVDGFVLRGSDFPEVASRWLWGEAGTKVALHYLRPGKTGVQRVTLRRVAIDPQGAEMPGVKMLTPENHQ